VCRGTLRGIADHFRSWLHPWAAKRNIPVIDAPKGRRYEFVEPYFEGAKPDEVVVVLKAREPARIMTVSGDKAINRWHLQFAERRVPSVQLLRQRSAMGPHVRAHVSLLAVHRAGLPQPASLAGQSDARGRHQLAPMLECLHALRHTRTPARARRPECRVTDQRYVTSTYVTGTMHIGQLWKVRQADRLRR
jgi:hypothetical protein